MTSQKENPHPNPKMRAAWEAYHIDDISKACQCLLDVGNECEKTGEPLPGDFQQLVDLCKFRDALEMTIDTLKEAENSSNDPKFPKN
jgi:hypothetical protein